MISKIPASKRGLQRRGFVCASVRHRFWPVPPPMLRSKWPICPSLDQPARGEPDQRLASGRAMLDIRPQTRRRPAAKMEEPMRMREFFKMMVLLIDPDRRQSYFLVAGAAVVPPRNTSAPHYTAIVFWPDVPRKAIHPAIHPLSPVRFNGGLRVSCVLGGRLRPTRVQPVSRRRRPWQSRPQGRSRHR